MRTALVVAGGGFQGLPVIRGLQSAGWRAVVVDSTHDNINRFEADGYHVAPPLAKHDQFVRFLKNVVAAERASAIFPTTMYDLPVLAELREMLERDDLAVFVSVPGLVRLLEDKARTYDAASRAGIPVLESISPESHDYSFALIGKPKHGWGGRDILHLDERAAFERLVPVHARPDYVWQRRLGSFREWSVDFAIDRQGVVSRFVVRQRIRASGGIAVLSDIASIGGPREAAGAAAAWLADEGGVGHFNIQFLEEPDGRVWLSDVNPRPGTSSVAALSAGVNLTAFLLSGEQSGRDARGGTLIRTLRETFVSSHLEGVRGVVFDLDETILDQKAWMVAKLDFLLSHLRNALGSGEVERFRVAALQVIDEGPWDRLIDVALARAGLPGGLSKDLIAAWRAAWPQSAKLHADAIALITDIQRRGLSTAIVTDNPAASQRQKLARLEGMFEPDIVVLTDELNAPKPDTAAFLEVSRQLGIPPDELVVVGDSPWRDALGALNAGYRCAVLVQRTGAMHNSNRELFENQYPQWIERLSWVPSLAGLDHLMTRRSKR